MRNRLDLFCVLLLSLATVFFLSLNNKLYAEDNYVELLVPNSYSNLTPTGKGGACDKPTDEEQYDYTAINTLFTCSIIYKGPSIKGVGSSLSVTLRQYSDKSFIKSDIALEYGYGDNLSCLDPEKCKLLHYHEHGKYLTTVKYVWVSDELLIQLRELNAGDKSILMEPVYKDYLAKYPPTMSFKKKDFEIQNLYREAIAKSFDVIYKNEERRGWYTRYFRKQTEYDAMKIQCEREASIRCWTGLETEQYSGCPITLNLIDDERSNEWNELKRLAKLRPIVPGNINVINKTDPVSKCFDSMHYKHMIYEALGM